MSTDCCLPRLRLAVLFLLGVLAPSFACRSGLFGFEERENEGDASVHTDLSAIGDFPEVHHEVEDGGVPDAPLQDDLSSRSDLGPRPDFALPVECLRTYVVDKAGMLYSFDSEALRFLQIGQPACIPRGRSINSMSISLDFVAYISDRNGGLFTYDLQTKDCSQTAYQPAGQAPHFAVFGMGFSRDTIGSPAETLYIADNSDTGLGMITRPPMFPQAIAGLVGAPELTGTADAELWGFFPDAMRPTISRFDKKTGALSFTIPLPDLAGSASAWAFAFWGGSFWVFLQRSSPPDGSTVVWRVDRMAPNRVKMMLPPTGLHIVGAGVSTCAPIGLDQ